MTGRHTFSKEERLTNKKIIDGLFGSVSHVKQFPLRLNILPVEEEDWTFQAKVILVTSKRNFKKAVDRNYQKRVLRELYRTRKSKLYEHMGKQRYALALIYVGNQKHSFVDIQKAMDGLILKAIEYFETDA
jgi:ribonuclease P protein component